MKILIIAAATLAAIMVGVGGMIQYRERERRLAVAVSQEEQEKEHQRRKRIVEGIINDNRLETAQLSLDNERSDIPRLEARVKQSTTPGESALATEKLRDAKERIRNLESEVQRLDDKR